MTDKKTKTISVNYLARVEGEGALRIKIEGKKVTDVQLKIFEPPRFFEAFLQGRSFLEAHDITSRICGICPIAYQMSTVSAIEDALGVTVSPSIRLLRRLIYCGEWIESHTLHLYLLHAPDFLGFESAIHMAKKHGDAVQRGLQLKKIGNQILELVGGREIHPINVRVGGFYRVPSRQEFKPLLERLKWAREASIETVKWVSRFSFPDFEKDYEYVCLKSLGEYPIDRGQLISNRGLTIPVREYEQHFAEEHVPHSTALQSIHIGHGPYMVGPLARFNLGFDTLSPLVKELAKEVEFLPPCTNPFKSIIARALEILYACDEAIRLIENYETPDTASMPIQARAGIGFGCTEAPRGILYNRYELDEAGIIKNAKIVPPTSQNQKSIETDLWKLTEAHLSLSKEKLTSLCEHMIRSYDPCISCASHFLKVNWEEVS